MRWKPQSSMYQQRNYRKTCKASSIQQSTCQRRKQCRRQRSRCCTCPRRRRCMPKTYLMSTCQRHKPCKIRHSQLRMHHQRRYCMMLHQKKSRRCPLHKPCIRSHPHQKRNSPHHMWRKLWPKKTRCSRLPCRQRIECSLTYRRRLGKFPRRKSSKKWRQRQPRTSQQHSLCMNYSWHPLSKTYPQHKGCS